MFDEPEFWIIVFGFIMFARAIRHDLNTKE
jgi:hypothetical protein